MPWVRLEDTFPEHPKVDAAGGDAGWLHVCALAYCNRNTTDGFIATQRLQQLSDRKQPAKLAARLVDCGLWEIDPRGGWQIHDYLDYQPSKATIDKERAAARDRMRKARESRGGSQDVQANIDRSSEDVRVTQPDPTRPDPSSVLSSFSESSTTSVIPAAGDESKIWKAMNLYADAETALRSSERGQAKYRKAIMDNGEHFSVMAAMEGQRPDCTPRELANAYRDGGWPRRTRQARGHPRECVCEGSGKVRDEAGYATDCYGPLRLAQ